MKADNDQIKQEFKRQVNLCCGIGKQEMILVLNEHFQSENLSDGNYWRHRCEAAENVIESITEPKAGLNHLLRMAKWKELKSKPESPSTTEPVENMHGAKIPDGCELGYYCNYPKCHCEHKPKPSTTEGGKESVGSELEKLQKENKQHKKEIDRIKKHFTKVCAENKKKYSDNTAILIIIQQMEESITWVNEL